MDFVAQLAVFSADVILIITIFRENLIDGFCSKLIVFFKNSTFLFVAKLAGIVVKLTVKDK